MCKRIDKILGAFNRLLLQFRFSKRGRLLLLKWSALVETKSFKFCLSRFVRSLQYTWHVYFPCFQRFTTLISSLFRESPCHKQMEQSGEIGKLSRAEYFLLSRSRLSPTKMKRKKNRKSVRNSRHFRKCRPKQSRRVEVNVGRRKNPGTRDSRWKKACNAV